MKTRFPIAASLIAICIIIGCTTAQQTTAYNTIFSLEKTTTSAYDGYLDLVIAGQVKTNAMSSVANAYNMFQAAAITATEAASYSTNAVADPALITLSQDVVNAINAAKK